MSSIDFTETNKGRVDLVGAGPGDPGLLTVKGQTRIKEADVVVYDRLAVEWPFLDTKEGCLMVYVGKAASDHVMPQDNINEMLYQYAKCGKKVVRLKGGDPFVFGRGGEEAEYLVKRGIEVEVVPGVTSALAGPLYAGIPVTHRAMASSFHVITGHRKNNEPDTIDYSALTRLSGTLIFLMGISNLEKIQDNLLKNGMNEETPVAIISHATTPKQKTIVSTLKEIVQTANKHSDLSPALIVIGEVVKLRENLSFFESKPLFSKTIVVTRAREKISELSGELFGLGANVIALPMIRIEKIINAEKMKEITSSFSQFKYVIFTSENGVRIFFEELHALRCDARIFSGKVICAIGRKTKEALFRHGICADVAPETGASEALWEKLSDIIKKEDNALLVQAKNGRKYLSRALKKSCNLTEIFPYETKAEETEVERLRELVKTGQIDAITFTSSSTVANFLSHISVEELKENNVLLFSIGESTTKTIEEAGLRVCAESEKTCVRSLAEAVKRAFCERRRERECIGQEGFG
ncbi:MAG: uroporphyrinogen-III C-methyltransferase [Synergistaceae bacterium]|nr:uroporphyrinogen-III C-methyltransferase [Synergistaceae bacterium]